MQEGFPRSPAPSREVRLRTPEVWVQGQRRGAGVGAWAGGAHGPT